jgi:hypothetical protein
MTTVVLSLLVFHGLLGGLDVLLNHELIEGLPLRRNARTEELLHSLRELVFGILFGSFAWLRWGGELVWGVAVLVALEFIISLSDTLLEDQIRPLSPLERTMHVMLFINFGAYTASLIPLLVHWYVMPTGFTFVYYGALSWALSLLSLAALAWSVRDGISHVALGRRAPQRATVAIRPFTVLDDSRQG